MTTTHYIVQTASEPALGRRWGFHKRIAVLEVPAGVQRASMISARSRDVVRVVRVWDGLDGRGTVRGQYAQALAEAEALAAALNRS